MKLTQKLNLYILLTIMLSVYVTYFILKDKIDNIFEYLMLFTVAFSTVLLTLNIFISQSFLKPIENIKNTLESSIQSKNFCPNQTESCRDNSYELKHISKYLKYLFEEIESISMEFENSVKKHTTKLENLNQELKIERDFVSTIIDKLSDIVFVVKNQKIIHANAKFYEKFPNIENIEQFESYFNHQITSEYLIDFAKKNLNLKIDTKSYAIHVESFNKEYYIFTFDDITDYKRELQFARDQNPLTKLAGNESIKNYLSLLLESEKSAVIAYYDFDNFKPFNDKYGFALGDEMIISFANLLRSELKELNSFKAHIGGDDYFSSIEESFDISIEKIKTLIYKFTENAKKLYNKEDREKGFVTLKDREGNYKNFPLLSISVSIINIPPKHKKYTLDEISSIIAKLKKISKKEKSKMALVSLIKIEGDKSV